MLYPVILSGGSGTRLWPLSRKNTPKQFLDLTGELSLFQQTVQRAAAIPGMEATVTVCSEEHRFMVGEQLQGIAAGNGGILLEPVARNTAPAIAIAASYLQGLDKDAMMLVLPADHLIGDVASFRDAVATARAVAESGWLVTFGIQPSAPETGYGYIKLGACTEASAYLVERFVEKPDRATAAAYLADGKYLWNSGMFMFRADRYLEELGRHAPDMRSAAEKAMAESSRDRDFISVDKDAFSSSPGDSIDYAVMEKTDRAAVIPVDCDWSDIGSWASLWSASERDEDGNRFEGDVLAIDARNCFVRSADRRMVAAVGVEDLIIVDTPDAMLVAHRDRIQDVKRVVEDIKASGRDNHALHRQVFRPWGSYDSIDVGEGFQAKRIEVKPGAALSLQKHHKRAEHWVCVNGVAEVTCDERVFELKAGEHTYIPLGSVHRLRNLTETPVVLVEVQCGDYVGEDDIVRYEDVYGRA
jgi:mannose-1-phosphate guanylyltransferase / mannose-6-phosphate isomerase